MERNNSNENYASIEIQIWTNEGSNGMFLFKNGYENELKNFILILIKKESIVS